MRGTELLFRAGCWLGVSSHTMSGDCGVKAGDVPSARALWMPSLLVMALCWNSVDKDYHCCFLISLSLHGILWVAEVQLRVMKTCHICIYMYVPYWYSLTFLLGPTMLPSQVRFYFIVLWCFKTSNSSSWREFFSFAVAIRSSMGGVAELPQVWFTDDKWQDRLSHRLGPHSTH